LSANQLVSALHQPHATKQVEERADTWLAHVEPQEAARGQPDDHRKEVDGLEDPRAPAAALDEQREAQGE
jgi:hypothetical protein